MDRFDEIETFVRIVETGSITAAANQLNIAKSAVSRRLQELENRLGVQLLQRTTRRLHLTDPGQELYQRGLRLLHDLEETEQQIISGQQALQGPLRISAPIAFSVNHLGSMINTFLAQHPNVEFDLQLDDREINMVEEGIDVTLRVGRLEDSSLIAKRIAPINFLLCAAPAYLEKHGEPTCAVALADHDAIGYTLSPEGRS
ncbi:LysR family transcriptional regulator [Candidatus Reidiella endopervernicosa]|uniref:LysR family transcriptional regulator n=1 Tax=Candidatus Reidiella endopervernicosa TaxID=2738883 RepID=A0A6N0HSZ6_9GAMM|nr:LysR family transcriptional regulator [Candidatus Reidiella endopervernicosa]